MTTQSEIISRADAKARGLRHYFTGKPCKRGNIAPRKIGNSDCTCAPCLEASNESKRRWQTTNKPPKGRFIHATEEERRHAKNESNKRWQRANPEKTRANKRRWEAKNPDKHREGAAARNKRYGERNRPLLSVKGAEWRKSAPHLVNANTMRRRARRLNATPSWHGELDDLAAVEAADLAKRREVATSYVWHVDHMIPLQARMACGLHVGVNLQVIPASVNVRKHNKMILTQPGEWLKHL